MTSTDANSNNDGDIKKADDLNAAGEHAQAYDLLVTLADSSDPEVLWRFARAAYEKSKSKDSENLKYITCVIKNVCSLAFFART